MIQPDRVSTALLADHPEAIPELRSWFLAAWPGWYGPGGTGNLEEDLRTYSNRGAVPLAWVAFYDGVLCGASGLKAESLPTHTHLTPWVTAGYVVPALRRRGIGRILLGAVLTGARTLGYDRVYCGTSTARTLLEREGWHLLDTVRQGDAELGIYRKDLVAGPVRDLTGPGADPQGS